MIYNMLDYCNWHRIFEDSYQSGTSAFTLLDKRLETEGIVMEITLLGSSFVGVFLRSLSQLGLTHYGYTRESVEVDRLVYLFLPTRLKITGTRIFSLCDRSQRLSTPSNSVPTHHICYDVVDNGSKRLLLGSP